MANFEIFQAVPADSKEIGALRAQNWKEQYAQLDGVTAEWMDTEVERIAGETGTQSRAQWIERATLPDASNYWLVARRNMGSRALVGFLEARKHDNSTQELRSLHVAPDTRGSGVGQALMDIAQSDWLDSELDTFLDVSEANEAGQRFYQRSPNNYEFTGHRFSYGPIPMLQMVRRGIKSQ